MNLAQLLVNRAASTPDQRAIIDGAGTVVTYGELHSRVQSVASGLRSRGLGRGDAVLLLVPVSIDLYVALLAALHQGMIPVVVDPGAGRAHIELALSLYPPKALIGSPLAQVLRVRSPAIRHIPVALTTGRATPWAASWRSRSSRAVSIVAASAEDPALLTFTSGSTGVPKAAMRSHGVLMAQHRAVHSTAAVVSGDVCLTALPVFVLSNLASGIVSLLPAGPARRPADADGAGIASQIVKWNARHVLGPPAFFERLVSYCEAKEIQMETLVGAYTGGAPVFPPLIDRISAVAPSADVVAVYGSTEAEPIAHLNRNDMSGEDRQLMRTGGGLLAGDRVEGVDLRVVRDQWGSPAGPWTDAELDRRSVPQGEVGEIAVAGEHVLRGYLDGRGDGETKIHVGERVYHRTGDAGRLDRSGRLWLLGRCSAQISGPAGTIYPVAIECALAHVDGVLRSAVIREGSTAVVAIETGPDASSDVLSRVKAASEPLGISEIRHFPSLPVDRRHNSKIDYVALGRMIER